MQVQHEKTDSVSLTLKRKHKKKLTLTKIWGQLSPKTLLEPYLISAGEEYPTLNEQLHGMHFSKPTSKPYAF